MDVYIHALGYTHVYMYDGCMMYAHHMRFVYAPVGAMPELGFKSLILQGPSLFLVHTWTPKKG